MRKELEKLLTDLGIQLCDNQGNYKLLNDVMDELAEKWNSSIPQVREENCMNYLSDKELAETIANHLPIGTEESERLIEGIKKGYMLGKVDYVIALESRDRALNELIRENRWLRRKLGYEIK